MCVSTIEAMLLTNCQHEEITLEDAARHCSSYESLLQQKHLSLENGVLVTTVKGQRAIDAYIATEYYLRRMSSPAISEYFWVILLGLAITALIVQFPL